MHEEERRQYELSKETAEVLSIKYHDLKHQLVALERKLPQNEIHSIHKILDTYDSIYHTGNEALDIILNEKPCDARQKTSPSPALVLENALPVWTRWMCIPYSSTCWRMPLPQRNNLKTKSNGLSAYPSSKGKILFISIP